jgi:hypothetical protein
MILGAVLLVSLVVVPPNGIAALQAHLMKDIVTEGKVPDPRA